MSADNVVQIADFRKDIPTGLDAPMSMRDQDMFAVDTVADQWANDLVHGLMLNFAERGSDIDFDDPVYGKLMEGLADVTRSMTRHHLGVFDETALMLQKYTEGEVSVGVLTMNEDDPDVIDVGDDSDG